uniref:STAS domain-containing protein n=1 Tax=Globisporangium ultimum (strain ATCC 200006 / CBS 805.95 / DAOM BR144) TaxID=431595 RepID=K3X504_GLOUD
MATRRNVGSSTTTGDDASSSLQTRFEAPKKTLYDRAVYFLPIIKWLGNYNVRRDLKSDIVSGITVTMMLIPQEVSLSTIMHVPAHHGLYTAATAPLVYALFGSSTMLSVASGSEVSLLVGTILNSMESEEERIATGIMFSFLSGCILLILRVLNLSQVADFFSRPVMGGFISAGGFLIALAQVQNWLQVTVEHASYPPQTVYKIFQHIKQTNKYSFWIGTLSIAFLFALRYAKKRFFPNPIVTRLFEKDAPEAKLEDHQPILTPVQDGAQPSGNYSHGFSLNDQQYLNMQAARAQNNDVDAVKRAPKSGFVTVLLFIARTLCDVGPLIVCIFGGIAGYYLGPKKLKLTGKIPSGFPTPLEPWYGYSDHIIKDNFGTVLYHAATICVVVYLSSIAMAKRLGIARGQDINTDQELTGLGMASIVCGFFQAMPPTGGMSRTAVNFMNARTQLSSIVTTLLIIISLYTLTGTLYYLPRATLASIIIVAGFTLIEFREAKWLYKVKRDEFYVWVASFVLTLGLGVLDGLIGSIVVSVLALMYKSKTSPVAILGELDNGSFVDRKEYPLANHLGDIVAVRVESSLFFANCERVGNFIEAEMARLQVIGIRTRGVVLDAQFMNDMDATTIQVLSDMQEKLAVRHVTFAIAGANSKIYDMFANTNLLKRIFAGNPSHHIDEVVRMLRALPSSPMGSRIGTNAV